MAGGVQTTSVNSNGVSASSGVHGLTNSSSAIAAQRAAAAAATGNTHQPQRAAAPTAANATAPVQTKQQNLSCLQQALQVKPAAVADTAAARAPPPSGSAADGPSGAADQHVAGEIEEPNAANGKASSQANAAEQADAGADGCSGRDAPVKKSDADMEIDGLLTHWTPVSTSIRTCLSHACLTKSYRDCLAKYPMR